MDFRDLRLSVICTAKGLFRSVYTSANKFPSTISFDLTLLLLSSVFLHFLRIPTPLFSKEQCPLPKPLACWQGFAAFPTSTNLPSDQSLHAIFTRFVDAYCTITAALRKRQSAYTVDHDLVEPRISGRRCGTMNPSAPIQSWASVEAENGIHEDMGIHIQNDMKQEEHESGNHTFGCLPWFSLIIGRCQEMQSPKSDKLAPALICLELSN